MTKVRRVATSLIFLLILVPNVWAANAVGQYFIDRGNDFVDIFRLRVGIPHKAHALGIKARVTALAQVGFVWFEGTHYGIDRRAAGAWKEKRLEGGLSVLYASSVQNEVYLKDTFKNPKDPWTELNPRGIVRNDLYWDDGRRHPFSIGAELQTGILPGLDLGLYPGEALDFLAGFFTIDYWDDDGAYVKRRERDFAEIAARSEQLEQKITKDLAVIAAGESVKLAQMEEQKLKGHQGVSLDKDEPEPLMQDTRSEENTEMLPVTIDESETTPVIVAPSEPEPTDALEGNTIEQPEAAVEKTAPSPEERAPIQSKTKPGKPGATTRSNLLEAQREMEEHKSEEKEMGTEETTPENK